MNPKTRFPQRFPIAWNSYLRLELPAGMCEPHRAISSSF
jgi:hypothetical protein